MHTILRLTLVGALISLLVLGISTAGLAATADLIDALEDEAIWAEFRGTGDMGVDAVIGRNPGGPSHVVVSPGTQFWAQAGGRQGMSTVGSVPIDLTENAVVRLTIPTACTNISRLAPEPRHVMYATRCPDERMRILCSRVNREKDDPGAVQLAVWAIANNPSLRTVSRHWDSIIAEDIAEGDPFEAEQERLLDEAWDLLERANMDPADFRMFR
jgi:hypothetical protein